MGGCTACTIARTIPFECSGFTAGGGGDIIDLQTNGAQAAGVGAALTAIESVLQGSIGATSGLVIYTGNDLPAATEAGVEDVFDGTVAASTDGAISITSASNKYYRKVKVANLM